MHQENENWNGIYLLVGLAFLFLVGRVGWGLGVAHERQRPPYPIGQGIFTEKTGFPANPIHNDVFITNHGTWAVYDGDEMRWKEAIILPFEP